MPLRLKVLSYKGSAPIQPLSAEFDQSGGSIGRKTDNTLVLADPEQYLSGHHARVSFEQGDYWLHDTSTNGSYLVNAGVNLNNSAAILQSQEIVRMGDYELLVEVVSNDMAVAKPVVSQIEPLFSGPLVSHVDQSGPFAMPMTSAEIPDEVEAPPASVFHDSFAPPVVEKPQFEDDTPAWLRELDSLSQVSPSSPSSTPTPSEPSSSIIPLNPELASSPFDDIFNAIPVIPTVESPSGLQETAETLHPEPEATPPSHESSITNAELMRLFLQGAGIQDLSFLPPEQWATTMTSAGSLFRILVEGVMDVLRARAEMKSEFRVSMTTLRAIDNNPLKFNPDVESVLKLMLGPANPAFMPSNVAISEAIKDIKHHQLAMTAGIQASLASTLQRFAPERIEQGLGEGLIFQKKARCWESYCEKYPQLKSLAMEDFFSDAFVEAYEKQMRLLERR